MRKRAPVEPLALLTDLPVEGCDADTLALEPFARTIAGAALGTAGPFTVGVYGSWGHGKTSLLRLAKDLLENPDTNTTAPIATVWFNAWQHEREEHPLFPLIAAIVDGIEDSLRRFERQNWADSLISSETKEKVREGWRQIGYSLRALARGMKFSAKGKVPLFGEVGIEFDAQKALQAEEILGKQDHPLAGELLYHHAFRTLQEQTEMLREQAGSLHANIVVFIDDLDRCDPKRAVHLLEGIKLILSQPGFVFALAVDRSVIEGYLGHVYQEEYFLPEGNHGQRYLDKLVQLPLTIPSHSPRFGAHAQTTIDRYLRDLQFKNPSVEAALEAVREVLGVGARENPRSFVRSLNAFLVDCQLWPLTQVEDRDDPYATLTTDVAKALAIDRVFTGILNDSMDGLVGDDAFWKMLASGDSPVNLFGDEPNSEKGQDKESADWKMDQIRLSSQAKLRRTAWEVLTAHPHAVELLQRHGEAYWGADNHDGSLRRRVHLFVARAELTSVDVDGCPVLATIIREQLEIKEGDPISSTRLVEIYNLDLSYTEVAEEELAFLERLSGLVTLNLTGIPVTDSVLAKLAELPLETLILTNSGVTDSGLEKLKGLSLKTLDLMLNRVTDAGLANLVGLPLESLDLDGTWVTDAGLASLAGLPLRRLDLRNTGVTDVGLARLAGLPLKSLTLTSTRVTDAGLANLVGLPLETLSLTDTQVTDAGLASFRGLSLKTLYLAGTQVTDAGLASLVDLPLISLSLTGTAVTDAGLTSLIGLPLRSLSVAGTQVTEVGRKWLREALPKCSVT